VGLLVFPAWALLMIGIAFLFLPAGYAWLAAGIVVTSPFAALSWLDRWDLVADFVSQLAPSEERRERLLALVGQREALMRELEVARERSEVGPAARASDRV
jgi:hypothetical protein